MSAAEKVKGKIRVYASGGCGINIGRHFEEHRSIKEVGFAEIDTVYIDCSRSNVKDHVRPDNSYILEGIDGSGKVRAENHEEISGRIRAILQEFKPVDLNIVLSSTGGGSGSVIAPLLVSELLANECPTVVIGVGSTDTKIEAENTLKTLKSYESIARLRKAPVVMSYLQNSSTMNRTEVDKNIFTSVISLAVLFSRDNHELDSRDLYNWLRFNDVTSFKEPALVSLTRIEGENHVRDLGNIISVATLAIEGENTSLKNIPDYQCVGILPTAIGESVLVKSPIHFITSDGVFPEVVNNLNKMLKELEAAQKARISKGTILTNTDTPKDTGLVL